ncbi:MAG TPA: hypothetical protein VNN79_23435 [Actinomycetota bacterium]|nr:hypothetical protein [Actinomycetota bacterium]
MIELLTNERTAVREAPVERAMLVPTTLGLAGVVVSAPSGPPAFGMLVAQGLDAHRSGVNGVWAKTARALAANGVAAMRVDFPGMGDSAGVVGGRDAYRAVLAEVVTWFRASEQLHRVGAIGACFGARQVLGLAAEGELDGPIALVTPALGRPSPAGAGARMGHRVRRALGRPEPVDRAAAADLGRTARRERVLVLLGELDRQMVAAVASARARLGTPDRVDVEMVPGERLHAFPTVTGQAAAIARLAAWAGSAGTSGPAHVVGAVA